MCAARPGPGGASSSSSRSTLSVSGGSSSGVADWRSILFTYPGCAGLDRVEKRVGRRHALLGPLRQAVPVGAALLIRDVNRLRRPALHDLDLHRLAFHGAVL